MVNSTDGRFVAVHGLSRTRIAKAWRGMIDRCSKPSRDDYQLYGGRGIKVCSRWKESLLNFLADMGHPPKEHSIDRIDNDGNYEPSNCKWSTRAEQARNRRSSKNLSFNGKTQTQAEWAEDLGISQGTLHARLKAGWSLDRALTTGLVRHGQAAGINRDNRGRL